MKGRLLLLILLATGLFAEEFRFSGDSSFSVIREGEEETRIDGNVSIRSTKRLIQADSIRILGKEEKVFRGQGEVRIEDYERDLLLQSDSFTYDEGASVLQLEGNASLEDRENEVLVKCMRLEFLQDQELALMQLQVRIFKDDIVCRSEYAQFFRDEEILELTGSPLVYRGEDRYEADRITVNLATDEILMYGSITGSIGEEDE